VSLIKKNKTPLYKQFIALRENVQCRNKVLKFKKKKWERYNHAYRKKTKWYRIRKPKDQRVYLITKYANVGTAFGRRHRDRLQAIKRFRLHYGNLPRKYLKKQIKLLLRPKRDPRHILIMERFESRLDTVLYRANFSASMRSAKQLILHGNVFVNSILIKKHSYSLTSGDIITVKVTVKCRNIISYHMGRSHKWPQLPKHLVINYATMQIVFRDIRRSNFATDFFFHLGLDRILRFARMR
jgi:ribosomal protein S4